VQRYSLQDPHSLVLLVAGLFGVPALVLLAVAIGDALLSGFKTALDNTQAGRSLLYVGWLAGFLGLCTASLLSVWTITAIFALFVCVGVLVAPIARRRAIPPIAATIAFAFLTILVAVSSYGVARAFASSHQVALSYVETPPEHLQRAIELAPWDSGTKVNYFYRMMLANQATIQGTDAKAASDAIADIDAQLKVQTIDFPEELLFYRLRVDLYTLAQGHAAYNPDALMSAIDDALAAFPDDPEFTERRANLQEEQDAK